MSPEDRRRAIVEAAMPLYREQGEVSTRQIAEAAGVAEGTIFRVFATKSELVAAVISRGFDPTEMLAALRAIDRTLAMEDRLLAIVTEVRRYLDGIIALMMHRWKAMREHDESGDPVRDPAEARRRQERLNTEIEAAVVEVLGDDAARLRVDVHTFMGYLQAMIFASAHPGQHNRQISAAEIVDVLLYGTLTAGTGRPNRQSSNRQRRTHGKKTT